MWVAVPVRFHPQSGARSTRETADVDSRAAEYGSPTLITCIIGPTGAKLAWTTWYCCVAGIIERCPPMNYSVELPNQSRVAELGYEEHARRCLTHAKQTFGAARSKRCEARPLAA